MRYMRKSDDFTYWKRPWQRWLVLVTGIFQVISLSLNIQEYKDIVQAGIFSSTACDSYSVEQSFQCAINGLTAAIFLGIFLIGIFVRSQKGARKAEGIFLLVVALIWGIVGFVLQLTSQSGIRNIWGLLLIVLFGGSIYTFWNSRNI